MIGRFTSSGGALCLLRSLCLSVSLSNSMPRSSPPQWSVFRVLRDVFWHISKLVGISHRNRRNCLFFSSNCFYFRVVRLPRNRWIESLLCRRKKWYIENLITTPLLQDSVNRLQLLKEFSRKALKEKSAICCRKKKKKGTKEKWLKNCVASSISRSLAKATIVIAKHFLLCSVWQPRVIRMWLRCIIVILVCPVAIFSHGKWISPTRSINDSICITVNSFRRDKPHETQRLLYKVHERLREDLECGKTFGEE